MAHMAFGEWMWCDRGGGATGADREADATADDEVATPVAAAVAAEGDAMIGITPCGE